MNIKSNIDTARRNSPKSIRFASFLVLTIVFVVILARSCSCSSEATDNDPVSEDKTSAAKSTPPTWVNPQTVPDGLYYSTNSAVAMTVGGDEVRLIQGKTTWVVLPNDASGSSLFDRNDLAKAHPHRLRLMDDFRVEFVRNAVPPFPEQRLVFEKAKSAAELAEKHVELGLKFLFGEGVSENDEAAIRFFEMAAAKDHPEAQYWLGRIHQSGCGVPEDITEAASWFKKAAEQGHPKAQAKLGVCYLFADGVNEDDHEAIRWLRKSAQQDDAEGQYWLGVASESGYGVPANAREALVWYRKAAEQDAGKVSELAAFRVDALEADAKRRTFICNTLRKSGIEFGTSFFLATLIEPDRDCPKRDRAVEEVNEKLNGHVRPQDILFWNNPPAIRRSTILITSKALFYLQDGTVKRWAFEDISKIDWERKTNGSILINGTPCKVVVDFRKPFVDAMRKILERVRQEKKQ